MSAAGSPAYAWRAHSPSAVLVKAAAACILAWAALAALGPASVRATGLSLPSGFQDTRAPFEGLSHPGLDEPTVIRFSPAGKVFVAERTGRILVYDSLTDATPTLFADLRTQVYDLGDRGILGMTLDPEFPTRPYVYVLYTYDHLLGEVAPAPKWGTAGTEGDPCPKPNGADVDDCPVSGRLVRLTAAGDHAFPTAADPAQTELIEDWCQQFSSHSIGDLNFGPEGALFASAGEGSNFVSPDYGQFGWPQKNQCGDPPGEPGDELTPPSAEGGSLRAQNTKNLDGSVIRVNPETGAGLADNPMAASADADQRRIVAYGMRNPFRFTIDPETHEVYVANVGWNTYEELDRFATVPSQPYNSGWPCYEGPAPTPAFQSLELNICKALYETPGSTSPPFFYYVHGQPVTPEDPCPDEYGSSLTGIDFYEGNSFPQSYDGALFFADSVRGCIYVMFRGNDDRPDPATTIPFLTEGGYPGVDIEEGPDGNLYYTLLFEGGEYAPHSGSIHRISYFSGNQPPVARLAVDHEWSAGDLSAEFDASESSDADGEELKYEWDPEGDGSFEVAGDETTLSRVFADESNHTVAVRVVDEQGATSVDRVTVYPHDTPPTPVIEEPEPDLEWTVGEPIHFRGEAEDTEDGQVPSTSLDWNSRLYHCPSACHTHPLQAFPAVDEGTLSAPDHELPSHIELILTATDSRGLEASTELPLYPRTVGLTIESEPLGIELSAASASEATPFALEAIEGSNLTLSAPASVQREGKTYTWDSWSDGGARVHTVVATGSTAFRAYYSAPEEAGPPLTSAPPAQPAPPDTRLRRHPRKRALGSRATFAFRSRGKASGFRCKLDRGPLRACHSPRTYRHLAPGRHVFRVIAIGPYGKMDPSPAVFHWRILCGPRRARLRHHRQPQGAAGASARRATRRRAGCARLGRIGRS